MRERAAAWAAVLIGAVLALTAAHTLAASSQEPHYGPARTLAPGVVARDVTFVSSAGHTVAGEIVSGQGGNPHPGVLFVHWLGDPKTTNHTEFEADAVALAQHGASSLLVDTMWARTGWFDTVGKSLDDDRKVTSGQLVDLLSALDLLTAQPGVDPARIAYVGHDFGAMMGELVAGADARPSWYVLMAGVPTLSQWYLLGKPAPEGYAAGLDHAFDLTGSLGRTRAKGFLFQFAGKDHYVTAADAAAFAAPARGATVITYDTDHALAVPKAMADRDAWLVEKLFGPS